MKRDASRSSRKDAMHCVVVSAVFPPEFNASATGSADIAAALSACGHSVTVLAPFPNRPAGRVHQGYRRTLYKKSHSKQGYTTVHCWATLAPRSTMFSRLLENISFGISSAIRVLCTRHIDVIYANTWPLFAQVLLVMAAAVRGVPVVLCIQDVYPESLISQHRITAFGVLARMMTWLDRNVCKRAAAVVVVSRSMLRIYEERRGIEHSRIHLIRNWGETSSLNDGPDGAAFRAKHNIPADAFVALYGGNVGPAAGADLLVRGCSRLSDLKGFYLVIAGSGSQLDECRWTARQMACERVVFHSPWLSAETTEVLAAADVLLLPTRGEQALASMPSKLISYLMADKPVIALVHPESESAEIIRSAEAGWVTSPDDEEALAECIRSVSELDPKLLRERGSNGRSFALTNLSRDANLPKMIDLIFKAAGNSSRPADVCETMVRCEKQR